MRPWRARLAVRRFGVGGFTAEPATVIRAKLGLPSNVNDTVNYCEGLQP